MCVYAHLCTEARYGHPVCSYNIYQLTFKTESLTKPRAHSFCWAGWKVKPSDPCFPFPALGLQVTIRGYGQCGYQD